MALGEDAASIPFVWGNDLPATEADPYFSPRHHSPPVESEEDRSELPAAEADPSRAPPAESELIIQSSSSDSAVSAGTQLPALEVSDSVAGISDLIFHVDKISGCQRLCIPSNLVKEILTAAHDSNDHPGFQRCYELVASSWYIHGLTRQLRDFIRHCPKCQILQTRRHASYGSLQPILSPPVPFHTITLDFILALPLSSESLDAIMSGTCKFTKAIQLIPGKSTWKAAEWAKALLERLDIVD